MWKRAFILMISAVLLMVSGAEAVTGHCSKMPVAAEGAAMSDHCADMMGAVPGSDTQDQTDKDSATCCCVITSAPVLLDAPFPATLTTGTAIWSRPIDTSGQSVPEKVAIPPPRI